MSNKEKMVRLQASYAAPYGVDDKGVIRGVSICTAGPALGHGVHLDESFIEELVSQASEMKLGLKARFGHPNMCNEALGTGLGRFRNFRVSKDRKQIYGDLYFSESSKITPHGDLAAYVTQLAKDDPDSFGTSIVFAIGDYYRKDPEGNDVFVDTSHGREEYIDFEGDQDELSEELYVTCNKLFGCDVVDEPAANPNGLFSGATVAGQVEAFFSEHPEIKKLLESNKNVVDIIETYGYKLSQYLSKEHAMEIEQDQEAEVFADNSDISDTDCADISTPDPEPEPAVIEEPEVEAMSARDFRDLVEEFGAEIATKVFDSNGDREDALDLYAEHIHSQLESANKEIASLKAKVKALQTKHDEVASDGVSFSGEKPKKRSLTSNINL